MVGNSLRAFWDEPRPPSPPVRVWRDWALVAVAVGGSVVEAVLRVDRAWLPVAMTVSIVIALSLLWRRTHPLAMVVLAFGTLSAFDLARIVTDAGATGFWTVGAVLLLPYALFRWGSGREAAAGLGLILAWLVVTHVADPTSFYDAVAGYGFFLFSAALGASVRFQATGRIRDIEQARLRQRNELARELHDTVGHHVSAIAIQAQAGRAVAGSDPARVVEVLGTIEDAASRALAEMRAMVGVLRDGAEPELVPRPGVADLRDLAGDTGDGSGPRIEVRLTDGLDDLAPSVGTALYRIAQEAVTNARRHADATHVVVEVANDDDRVRLVVRDDGTARTTGTPTSGYGLLGMTERAALLGGSLRAGPAAGGGWTVEALLPHHGEQPAPARVADRSAQP